MEATFKTKIIKIKDYKKIEVEDILVREIKLEILVNGEKIGTLMATPTDQDSLAIGYLMSENIIENVADIESIELLDDGMKVSIKAKVNKDKIKKLNAEGVVISGCGRGMTANIDIEAIEAKKLKSDFTIDAKRLFTSMETFYTQCDLYEQTGCVHTAKLYTDEKTFFIGEDIAQHNTIDKVVGKARMAKVDMSRSFLMVSGRLSSEMVAKAIMHGIPILASRTATTCLGYMIATKFDLTLVGFVRGERLNIYANDWRINV